MNLRSVSVPLALAFLISPAFAQQTAAPAAQTPAPAANPATTPKPVLIDIATAKKLIAVAEAAAVQMNAKVSIAVVDGYGDLVALERMDGAVSLAVTSSEGKARTAVVFGMPSAAVQTAIASGQPVSTKITVVPGGTFGMMAVRGAVPIIKDGKVLGAVGVGGSASINDEKFAQAAVDSYGK